MKNEPLIIQVFKEWFGGLNQRQQRLFVAFAVMLALSVYSGWFLKPALKQIADFKKQGQDNKGRYKIIVSQFPDIKQAERYLFDIRQKIKAQKITTSDTQVKLLRVSQVSRFLTELVRVAEGLSVDFQYIKQTIEEPQQSEKAEFNRLYIDVKLEAGYENAVTYIKRVEEISPFVKIDQIDVASAKDNSPNLITVTMKMSALVVDAPGSAENVFKGRVSDEKEIKLGAMRNPLMPKVVPEGQAKKNPFQLTGITYCKQAKASTAIINDTIVREGEEIGSYKVESIMPDAVILSDGLGKETLKVER